VGAVASLSSAVHSVGSLDPDGNVLAAPALSSAIFERLGRGEDLRLNTTVFTPLYPYAAPVDMGFRVRYSTGTERHLSDHRTEAMQYAVCGLRRTPQPVEKRARSGVDLRRCLPRRRRPLAEGVSAGGRRASTCANFLGPLPEKVSSRLMFWPAAITMASAFTRQSLLTAQFMSIDPATRSSRNARTIPPRPPA
jgi:hypothetical protein